jgi:hypothetical protein
VGKSTVGWALFSQLVGAGRHGAYLDLDQISLCYPQPADDPDNFRLQATNLGAMWPVYRAAGAGFMIVSGLVNSAQGVRRYADLLPGTAVTVCRLRVGTDELRARIDRRGWLVHLADEAVENAEALDGSDFADLCVDTDGVAVPEVVRRVRERAGGWPGTAAAGGTAAPGGTAAAHAARTAPSAEPAVPVLLVCGPPAVGKSTAGWEVFSRVLAAGVKAAYVDLAQIGFCRPAPDGDPDNHRVRMGNLRRMWPALRATGARCLVLSGGVPADPAVAAGYTAAVPGAALTVCRLHAGPARLTERILARGRGEGPGIPGNELVGRPTAELHRFAEHAMRVAAELDRAGVGDVRVDTDGLTVGETADLIGAATGGWPSPLAATPGR